jgi:hypothetical protein
MARTFGSYNPVVPLGVTWEETLQLTDADGDPIDLTGYGAQAQLRERTAVLVEGEDPEAPVLELVTAGLHDTPPAWPVVEAITIASPATGTLTIRVEVDELTPASPTNTKRKLLWELRLINEAGYAIPVVNGKVVFLPACTL